MATPKNVILKYKTTDIGLNKVLEAYRDKINNIIKNVPWVTASVDYIRFKDTNDTHYLEMFWGEDALADRTLELNVNSASRVINLAGNLSITGNLTTSAANQVANWTITNALAIGASSGTFPNAGFHLAAPTGNINAYITNDAASGVPALWLIRGYTGTKAYGGMGVTGAHALKLSTTGSFDTSGFTLAGNDVTIVGTLGCGAITSSDNLLITSPSSISITATATEIAEITECILNSDTASWSTFSKGSAYAGTTHGGLTGNNQVGMEAQNASSFYIGCNTAAPIIFCQGRVEKVRIDTAGNIALKSNAELRFYDNGNYVGFEAPALGADQIWVLPTADGALGEHWVTDGAGTLSWTTGAGTGNVIAAANFDVDNTIIRSDGVAKGVQKTGVVIDNSNNISGVGTIASGVITWTGGTSTNANTAYTHSQDNSQAHTDYLLNTTDSLSGDLTITGHLNFTGNVTITAVGSGANISLQGGGGTADIQSQTIASRTTVNSGNVYCASGSPYRLKRYTSSLKYKDKIKDLELDSSLIYNLRPRSYNSKCDNDDKSRRFVGLITEEVERVFPGMINYGENNEAEGYDNQMLMTLMLAEEQKLRVEVDELRQELDELKIKDKEK